MSTPQRNSFTFFNLANLLRGAALVVPVLWCLVGCTAEVAAPGKSVGATQSLMPVTYQVHYSVTPFEKSMNQPRLFVVPALRTASGDGVKHAKRGFWRTQGSTLGIQHRITSAHGTIPISTLALPTEDESAGAWSAGAHILDKLTQPEEMVGAEAVRFPLQRWYQAVQPPVEFYLVRPFGLHAATDFGGSSGHPVQLGSIDLCRSRSKCEKVWVFAHRDTPIWSMSPTSLDGVLAPGESRKDDGSLPTPMLQFAHETLEALSRALHLTHNFSKDFTLEQMVDQLAPWAHPQVAVHNPVLQFEEPARRFRVGAFVELQDAARGLLNGRIPFNAQYKQCIGYAEALLQRLESMRRVLRFGSMHSVQPDTRNQINARYGESTVGHLQSLIALAPSDEFELAHDALAEGSIVLAGNLLGDCMDYQKSETSIDWSAVRALSYHASSQIYDRYQNHIQQRLGMPPTRPFPIELERRFRTKQWVHILDTVLHTFFTSPPSPNK